MGRNILPDDKKKLKMSVSIDAELRDWLRSTAESTGINQSRLLGSAIKCLKDQYELSDNNVNKLIDRG